MPNMDPSIYQNAFKPTVAPQDPMDSMGKAMQLKHAMQQQEMGDLQLQQQKLAATQSAAFRDDVQAAGGDIGKLKAAHLKHNKVKEWSEIEKTQREADAAAAKLTEMEGNLYANVGGAVLQAHEENKPEIAQAAWDAGLRQAKAMGRDTSTMPRQYDPQMARGFYQIGVSALERYKRDEDAKKVVGVHADENNQAFGVTGGGKSVPIVNATTGAAQTLREPKGVVVNTGEKLPPGWRQDPDKPGSWIPIPGGPHDPKSKDKAMTDSQAAAYGFGIRAREADGILGRLEAKGLDASSGTQKIASSIPFVGNYLTPEEFQGYDQAKRNFISAVLRKESGAAIMDSEFKNEDKKYFPQPGDTPSTIKQKAASRKTAIGVLQTQSGRELAEDVKPVKDAKPKARSVTIADLKNIATQTGKPLEQVTKDALAKGWRVL